MTARRAAAARGPLLALCGTVAAGLAAGLAPAQSPISTARCQQLLDQLDQQFNRGSADGYLQLFRADQALLHDLHSRRIRSQLSDDLERCSQLLSTPARCGEHTVFAVRCTLSRRGRPQEEPLQQQLLFAVRAADGADGDAAADADVVPTVVVEVPADAGPMWRFRCPACNYQLGPADGWLCVPISQSRTNAVEGATFLLLGTDIAVDLSVQLGDEPLAAAAQVDELTARLRALAPASRTGMTEPWSPPSLRAHLDEHGPLRDFSAARSIVDLPTERVVVYAAVLGRLRHLLLVHGSRASLDQHQARVDALLLTYELLALEVDAAQQAAAALDHHTRSRVSADGRFRSDAYALAVDGPPQWPVQLRCGGSAFHAEWSCPDETGRLLLTGHLPPPGLAGWSPALADRWLRSYRERLAAPDGDAPMPDTDSDWSEPDEHGERRRSLELGVAREDGTERRLLLLVQRRDLLVVVDGRVRPGRDQELVRRALASVRRN